MKYVVGGDEDNQTSRLADEFYKSSGGDKNVDQGFESYFKQDMVKLVSLKDAKAVFPNGAKMTLIENKNEYTLFVETAAGGKYRYIIDAIKKKVFKDKQECSEEERKSVVRMLKYMKAHCLPDNSNTFVFKSKKEGVI